MDASIIIPLRDNLKFTEACLASLEETEGEISREIIVIDNASTDGTAEFLRRKSADGTVRVLRNDPPLPFAASCNRGARAARGEYLVFLNNDTEALPGWLDAMMKCARSVPGAGAVGAKLIYPENTVQHAGIAFYYSEKYRRVNPYPIFKEFPRNAPAVSKLREYQAVTGACLLTPKRVFDETGGFDERFINCFEDVDYCLRLRENGYKVIYTPEAELVHYESRTAGRNDHQVQAGIHLQRKWAGKFEPDDHLYLIPEGFVRYEDENGDLNYTLGGELRLWWELILKFFELDQVQTALEEVEKLERLVPSNAALTSLKMKCLNALGEYRRADRLERRTPEITDRVNLAEVL